MGETQKFQPINPPLHTILMEVVWDEVVVVEVDVQADKASLCETTVGDSVVNSSLCFVFRRVNSRWGMATQSPIIILLVNDLQYVSIVDLALSLVNIETDTANICSHFKRTSSQLSLFHPNNGPLGCKFKSRVASRLWWKLFHGFLTFLTVRYCWKTHNIYLHSNKSKCLS